MLYKIKKIVASTLVLSALCPLAVADGLSAELSLEELGASDLSEAWREREGIVTVGSDGKIVFLFGQTQPTLVCAPLQLCDIELEAGEVVRNLHSGDSVRWNFSGARSGVGGEVPHIIVKPTEAGLLTSLVITTERRTYHLALKSSSNKYMARVGFDYGTDAGDVVEVLAATAPMDPVIEPVASTDEMSLADNSRVIEALDFEYKVKGDVRWRPERVYNDGSKTYIEMPPEMGVSEAPILLLQGQGKGREIVNYRLIDGRYVVDRLFSRAYLVAGVGRKRDEVRIDWLNYGNEK